MCVRTSSSSGPVPGSLRAGGTAPSALEDCTAGRREWAGDNGWRERTAGAGADGRTSASQVADESTQRRQDLGNLRNCRVTDNARVDVEAAVRQAVPQDVAGASGAGRLVSRYHLADDAGRKACCRCRPLRHRRALRIRKPRDRGARMRGGWPCVRRRPALRLGRRGASTAGPGPEHRRARGARRRARGPLSRPARRPRRPARGSPFLALAAVSGELLYAGDRVRESHYQLFVLRRAGDLAPFERARRAHALSAGR